MDWPGQSMPNQADDPSASPFFSLIKFGLKGGMTSLDSSGDDIQTKLLNDQGVNSIYVISKYLTINFTF